MKEKLAYIGAAVYFVTPTSSCKQISHLRAAEAGARILITESIDETKLVTTTRSTRPETKVAKNDRGRVEESFVMEGMLLQLKRPPELEKESEQYIDSLTDKSSPNFHQLIPAALAPAVVGVFSMHNFKPRAMNARRMNYMFTSGTITLFGLVGRTSTIGLTFVPLSSSSYQW